MACQPQLGRLCRGAQPGNPREHERSLRFASSRGALRTCLVGRVIVARDKMLYCLYIPVSGARARLVAALWNRRARSYLKHAVLAISRPALGLLETRYRGRPIIPGHGIAAVGVSTVQDVPLAR